VYEQKLKAVKGIGKIYWNTMQALPGNYTVKLSHGNMEELKTGIVLENWIWPVLNFQGTLIN